MPEAEKKKAIAEFSFTKGILVATFSGIMSACFAFALTAGASDRRGLTRRGHHRHLGGLPKLRRRLARRVHHQLHLVLLP